MYDIMVTRGDIMNVKPITKERLSYSIDKTIAKKFNELCKKKMLNRSAWVEAQMKSFIEKEDEK
jgi:metal-responsive CopG/Arc/MetJ family transcriptional regulator